MINKKAFKPEKCDCLIVARVSILNKEDGMGKEKVN